MHHHSPNSPTEDSLTPEMESKSGLSCLITLDTLAGIKKWRLEPITASNFPAFALQALCYNYC